MKKIICFFVVMLTLAATSCKKDVNPPEDVASGSFVATISEGSARNIPRADGNRPMTTINDARDVYWYINDQISVNGAIYTLRRDTTISGYSNYGVFTNSERTERPAKDGNLWKAIYPATPGYSLPATQDGSFKNVPMYAQSENEYLKFDIITAVLKIVVPADANGAKLITLSSTGKALSGAFTIADAGTKPYASMSNNYSTVNISGQFATGNIVYVPIPAGSYSNLYIRFYSDDKQEKLMLNKEMTSSTTFIVNKLYTIKIDTYFYFEAKEDNSTVLFKGNGVLEYSLDKSNWNDYTNSTTITLTNVGDRVYFRADGTQSNTAIGLATANAFELTGNLKVGGNILYLVNATANDNGFVSNTDVFQYLFLRQSALTDASELKLPSCTLSQGCFHAMFDLCTCLVSAPALPSTNLASYCYSEMFCGCTALAAAPELPATTMVQSCYLSMFNGCTALTTAPALPALTLADACYQSMFLGCTSLTDAPVLPAATLTNNCYQTMFYGCSNLSSVTMKATSSTATDCLTHWLECAGTSATGTDARKVHVVNDAAVVNAVQSTLPTGEYAWTAVGDQ